MICLCTIVIKGSDVPKIAAMATQRGLEAEYVSQNFVNTFGVKCEINLCFMVHALRFDPTYDCSYLY